MNERKAGVILSYISMGLNALIGFVYIPMLLLFLSKEQYGLYQLVGSMIAYLAIMDFGLASTTTRYYARYMAQEDTAARENLLATTLRLYSGVAVLIFIVGFAALHLLLPLYRDTLSPAEIHTAVQLYWVMLVNLAIIILGNIFVAVIQAHQKFIFLRCLNIANILLQPVFVYLILHVKASVLVIALVQTVCNAAMFSINMYYCFAKLKIKFKMHKWDGVFAREILYFSLFIFLNAVMDQVYWRTGQLILGAVTGAAAVAVYAVAVQLDLAYMSFSATLSSVFLPHISALAAKSDDMTEINKIFIKIGRIQFFIVMLMFCGFFLFGRQFINLWIGDSFKEAYLYALILMAALICPLIQNTGLAILQAKNKHAFRAVVYIVIAIINVAVSIPLAKHYGGLACAIVTAACLVLGQGIIINFYYAKLGVDIKNFFKQILKITPAILLPFALWCVIIKYVPSSGLVALGVNIAAFVLLYSLSAWYLAFNTYEKGLVTGLTGNIKKILGRVR